MHTCSYIKTKKKPQAIKRVVLSGEFETGAWA